MEWQLIGKNQWVFGTKVRGVIRNELAVVYRDPDQDYPWVWWATDPLGSRTGYGTARNLTDALEKAEEHLSWCIPELPNSHLLELAEKFCPPDEWFEEEIEDLF